MKRIAGYFSGKALVTMVAISGIFIIAPGCNGSDYNKPGESNTMTGNDTTQVVTDTVNNSPGTEAKKDSSATTSTEADKVPMADTKGAKKAKKGKVSIVMSPASTDKNTNMEADKEGYYSNTEVLPAFPGGQKALERFFEDNIKYPEAATENDVQGMVKLIFNVDENGKIYQPLPVGNKIGYGIEDEAIRVFNKMPKWTPGKIKGKNVKTRFTLPIKFQLD